MPLLISTLSAGVSNEQERGGRFMKEKEKKCFVVMTLGSEGTEHRRRADQVFQHIIKEAVEPLGYACQRALEIPESGIIDEQIKRELRKADLVVADLTERNPNVFYEVGIRHALNQPLITISQGDLGALPFDWGHMRTIGYDPTDLDSVAKCKQQIAQFTRRIEETGREPLPDVQEPVSRSVETGLDNVYRVLSDLLPEFHRSAEKIDRLSQRCRLVTDEPTINDLVARVDGLVRSSQALMQMSQLGFVGVYRNRRDAIEQYFFNVLREEPKEINVVGSTIFGLKGHQEATFEKIIEILRAKHSQAGMKLRVILTHWKFIGFRQDQEKTEKNIARYVISKELKDAVDILKSKGLISCVKFYRGSPTCFTIIANGQRQMLMNPYPYQSEAYNSWCIVVRDVPGGIYAAFKKAHFDDPWENDQLCIPYSESFYKELLKKHAEDIETAKKLTLGELSAPKRT